MRLPIRPPRQARTRFLVALILFAALLPTAARARWVGDFHVPGIDIRGSGQTVNKVIGYGDGLVAGGRFAVADSSWAANVAQWNGIEWRPMGDGLSGGAVNTLVLHDGQVVAAGAFTASGAVLLSHVARWDGAQWHPLGDGVVDPVAALLVSDGGLYAASCSGSGAAASSRVSHWDGQAWTQVGSAFSGTVAALESYHGQLVAGLRRLETDPARSSVVVWDGATWAPLLGAVGDVIGLALWQGKLVIAGSNLGPATPPLGYVDLWDGLVLTTIGQGYPLPCSEKALGLDSTSTSLRVLHEWYCEAGRYSSGDLSIDVWNGSAWSTLMSGLSGTCGLSTWGDLLVVNGRLAGIGTVASNGVIAVHGTVPQRLGAPGDGVSGEVLGVAARPDSLFVAGRIATAGTARVEDVAVRTAQGWTQGFSNDYVAFRFVAANPRGSYAAGGQMMDTSAPCFDAPSSFNLGYIAWPWAWRTFSSSATEAWCLIWSHGQPVAGVTPGADNASPVCVPHPGACSSWSPLGQGLGGGPVFALTNFRDDLVAGGNGMTIDGQAAGSLVAWDGQSWRSIGGPGGGVHALADLDTMLVAAGGSAADGFRCRVFSWKGGEWTPMGAPFPSGGVKCLVSCRGRLYAGGDFSLGGVQTGGRLARWDGEEWQPVPGAPDGVVAAMTVLDDRLYVGGAFGSAGGRRAANLACWEEPPMAVVLGGFSARRGAGAAEVAWTVAEVTEGVAFHLWREDGGCRRVRLTAAPLAGCAAFSFTDPSPPVGPADYWLEELPPAGGVSAWHGPAHLAAAAVPAVLRLSQNRPNPFNPRTTLAFALPLAGHARLSILDARGREVAVLLDAQTAAGERESIWDGRDGRGRAMASGIYFARLATGVGARTVKITLSR